MMPNPNINTPSSDDDRMARIELLISWLLRGGVVISMATILAGLLLMFIHHPEYLDTAADLQRLTTPGAAFRFTLTDVVGGAAAGHGQAFVALGLLLLIATPIMRVAVAIVGFALQRDRTFTVISTVVLLVVLISFLVGRAG